MWDATTPVKNDNQQQESLLSWNYLWLAPHSQNPFIQLSLVTGHAGHDQILSLHTGDSQLLDTVTANKFRIERIFNTEKWERLQCSVAVTVSFVFIISVIFSKYGPCPFSTLLWDSRKYPEIIVNLQLSELNKVVCWSQGNIDMKCGWESVMLAAFIVTHHMIIVESDTGKILLLSPQSALSTENYLCFDPFKWEDSETGTKPIISTDVI